MKKILVVLVMLFTTALQVSASEASNLSGNDALAKLKAGNARFEKMHLVHLFENGLLAYIFTTIVVICGSVVFSVCAKWLLNKIETSLKERVNNRRINHV